jgi:hypothetical protein
MTDKPDTPEWGVAMAALSNDRRRNFVLALFHPDCPAKGDGQDLFAAQKAGYGKPDGSTSDATMGVIASRLRADPAIQAAIRETFAGVVHSLAPNAARELRFKLDDRKDRDQIKALQMITDRMAPVEQTLAVKVDYRPPSEEITAQVFARIQELARRAGLPPPPVIDAEFEVVE